MAVNYINNKELELNIGIFQRCEQEQAKLSLQLKDLQAAKDRLSTRGTPHETISQRLEAKQQEQTEIITKYNNSYNYLAEAFLLLSQRIANYKSFTFIDVDDAAQEGVLVCFQKVGQFDPAFGKAFNYMTTCILNQFRQLYRSGKYYNDLKFKYLDHLKSNDSSNNGRVIKTEAN